MRTRKASAADARKRRYESRAADVRGVAAPGAEGGTGGMRAIGATEAARNFSDLISRICYRGEIYVVERGGRAMCEMRPVAARRFTGAQLLELLAKLAPPSEEFLSAVEETARGQAAIAPSPWES
jgi:antitoxin (DNA-binding transcriptional repressor) of toxin-antitoxin stability system